jgi:hypothetical protein
MSNTGDENTPEEKAIDALIAAAFKEDASEVDEKDIEQYGEALTDDDRRKLDDSGKGLIEALFAGEKKKVKEEVSQEFSAAMNRGGEGAVLTESASEEIERKIKEARERRKAQARNRQIQEHDMVRVRAEIEVEGYLLHAGMVGTVVSVYRGGEAFAVEFPELERGSAVVTLYRDQVERTEKSDE